MAIALEASSLARTTAAVSSLTTSFTVTLANLLVVKTAIRSATDANRVVTGITWNGTALTKLREDQADADDIGTGIWYLANPAAGTFNVVTTCTGSINNNLSHVIEGLTGAETSSPVDTTGSTASTATGGGTTATTTVTTASANAWVVDICYAKVDTGVTVSGAGHTQRQNSSGGAGADSTAAGTIATTSAGSYSPAWTGSGAGDAWIISAGAFKEGTGSQTISPGFISSGEQVFSPTFAPGAVTITPGAIAAGSQVFAPSLAQIVTPGFIASGEQLFAPTLAPGSVTLTPGFVSSGEQVFAPNLGGGVAISPGFIASGEQVFTPTLVPGSITVTPGFLASGAQVFQPALAGGDVVSRPPQRPTMGVG